MYLITLADTTIQLGKRLTKGHGAGADPKIGEESAKESIEEIKSAVEGADMVFVAVGLGGGTGTGAAPIIADICKGIGALTVAVATKPFYFEGGVRAKNARNGWTALKKSADAMITIPNDRLISLADKDTKFTDSMKMADEILLKAVRSITDLLSTIGYINLDFADICTVMSGIGVTFMGTGEASGPNRGEEAVKQALECPFLQDIDLGRSKKSLVNITACRDNFTLSELYDISNRIKKEVHEEALMIIGVVFDDTICQKLRVTILTNGELVKDDDL